MHCLIGSLSFAPVWFSGKTKWEKAFNFGLALTLPATHLRTLWGRRCTIPQCKPTSACCKSSASFARAQIPLLRMLARSIAKKLMRRAV